jgi:Cof subfamily protein (haloacid dehalogenase superfamily)
MKILASDYDGTIRKEIVNETDTDSIRHFRSLGHKFGIVTGRSIGMIYEELNYHGVEYDFLIANNGAIIINDQDEILFQANIESSIAHSFIDLAVQEGEIIVLGTSDGFQFGRILSNEIPKTHSRITHASPTNIDDLLEKGIFNSFFFRCKNTEETHAYKKKMDERFGDLISFHFNNGSTDVCCKGISKASGVEFIKNHFKPEAIYTFGDNHNDIEMTTMFGGFCIESSVDELKQVAQRIFPDLTACINAILKL